MQTKSELQQGWEFAASIVGAHYSGDMASNYVNKVQEAIQQLEYSINNHPYRGQDVAHFQGYVQEVWHEGTFNVDAVAQDVVDRAHVLNSHVKGSIDIQLDSGKSYSAKSYVTGAKSAVAQAAFDGDTGKAVYSGQERLIPTDQLADAKDAAHRRMIRNSLTRKDVSEAYRETEARLTDSLSHEGVESKTASRSELEEMAHQGKEQNFKADEAGVTADSTIKMEYMMKQALKAGYTAAAISVALQLAPEIYNAIDYLIKNGEIKLSQIQHLGEKGITAGAEGFLKGSVTCSLAIMCEKEALGEALKEADPTHIAYAVVIVMQTVKNSIMVAAGKMTAKQMGAQLVDILLITGGYAMGAHIGGMIGQALGFELPVVGYLLGSLVGTAFSVTYNIGKKKFISFCVDTGFTCFGLVDQNYELSDEVLANMGIETIPIPRTNVNLTYIDVISTSHQIEQAEYETIDITMLKRGVIGINKVGYVLS
jgi:hypothetical protein